jgi:hypothetical protein
MLRRWTRGPFEAFVSVVVIWIYDTPLNRISSMLSDVLLRTKERYSVLQIMPAQHKGLDIYNRNPPLLQPRLRLLVIKDMQILLLLPLLLLAHGG